MDFKIRKLSQSAFLLLSSVLLSNFNSSGQKFGTLQEEVSTISDTKHHIQVWQVRPYYTKNATYQFSMQHAVKGEKGSFYLTAWTDTDNDGKPDKEISRSELKTADKKGEWSTWTFKSDYKKLFIGNMWEHKDELVYYQEGGFINGYTGLSNSVYFAREFSSNPIQSAGPCYTNIKITAICDIVNEIGITTEEVKNIENVKHHVVVWKIKPELCIPGTYKISVKHAESGKKGSFFILAWTDTNEDGKPDKIIAKSELKTANQSGQWSSFEFNSEYDNVFAGMAWEDNNKKIYRQKEGKLKGYVGLSNTGYYSTEFYGNPNELIDSTYTNIKVDIYN